MRKELAPETINEVLTRSRRRCALCFGLRGDLRQKEGQLAHVDRDASNNDKSNICFLCMEHHNLYDTKYSQSKGYTAPELNHYRTELYAQIEKYGVRSDDQGIQRSSERVFLTLCGNSFDGVLHVQLKNSGDPFNIRELEVATPGARVRSWHPRSMDEGQVLEVPTEMPGGAPTEIIYHMKVRDRLGETRSFQILVDTRPSPANYDFVEISRPV